MRELSEGLILDPGYAALARLEERVRKLEDKVEQISGSGAFGKKHTVNSFYKRMAGPACEVRHMGSKFFDPNVTWGEKFVVHGLISYSEFLEVKSQREAGMKEVVPESHWDQVVWFWEPPLASRTDDLMVQRGYVGWRYEP